MGGHWINCKKCGTLNRFRHDTAWILEDGIHDFEDWKCSKCEFVILKGEDEQK